MHARGSRAYACERLCARASICAYTRTRAYKVYEHNIILVSYIGAVLQPITTML